MTKGYKTTEFWLTLAAMIVGLLLASGVLSEGGTALQIAAFIGTALAAIGYDFTRGKVKVADAFAEIKKADGPL